MTLKEKSSKAVETLRAVLRPLNIIPLLDVLEIDEATFEADPLESNRIWIAGRPLEDWLGGNVGGSRCDSVCGGSDCRTVQVEGVRLETIPGRLIVKAALLAASEKDLGAEDAAAAEGGHITRVRFPPPP